MIDQKVKIPRQKRKEEGEMGSRCFSEFPGLDKEDEEEDNEHGT